jgi:D-glycero-D-manno-heptose 1,7-bisphosphate phosphatase
VHHRQPPLEPHPDPAGPRLKPAVVFDRDGVVNRCPGPGAYVLSWEDFHFNPGIIEALRLCRQRGYVTVLATSQQGVGKGLMSLQELDRIHQRMQQELQLQQAAFDSIKSCTCLQRDPTCRCRKPSPQMLHEAAAELGLDLARSLLIGDAPRDIDMARQAGLSCCIRILGTKDEAEDPPAEHRLEGTAGLAMLLKQLLAPLPTP